MTTLLREVAAPPVLPRPSAPGGLGTACELIAPVRTRPLLPLPYSAAARPRARAAEPASNLERAQPRPPPLPQHFLSTPRRRRASGLPSNAAARLRGAGRLCLSLLGALQRRADAAASSAPAAAPQACCRRRCALARRWAPEPRLCLSLFGALQRRDDAAASSHPRRRRASGLLPTPLRACAGAPSRRLCLSLFSALARRARAASRAAAQTTFEAHERHARAVTARGLLAAKARIGWIGRAQPRAARATRPLQGAATASQAYEAHLVVE
jgi:hypothetical protein